MAPRPVQNSPIWSHWSAHCTEILSRQIIEFLIRIGGGYPLDLDFISDDKDEGKNPSANLLNIKYRFIERAGFL